MRSGVSYSAEFSASYRDPCWDRIAYRGGSLHVQKHRHCSHSVVPFFVAASLSSGSASGCHKQFLLRLRRAYAWFIIKMFSTRHLLLVASAIMACGILSINAGDFDGWSQGRATFYGKQVSKPFVTGRLSAPALHTV